jgi:hypothetical protein
MQAVMELSSRFGPTLKAGVDAVNYVYMHSFTVPARGR